ncbi:hypothetical protein Bbelb_047230 [Branchiostoma belcheri]|nr:hypothetical protein Bbelb_047230 [Branchiostoma belcheri]
MSSRTTVAVGTPGTWQDTENATITQGTLIRHDRSKRPCRAKLGHKAPCHWSVRTFLWTWWIIRESRGMKDEDSVYFTQSRIAHKSIVSSRRLYEKRDHSFGRKDEQREMSQKTLDSNEA